MSDYAVQTFLREIVEGSLRTAADAELRAHLLQTPAKILMQQAARLLHRVAV